MKKLLYSLLIIATVLGLGGTVLAADGDIAPKPWTDLAGHEAEGELTLMAALGIFTGDSGLGGAVKPDDPITRAQFCKVLVQAIGKGSTAAGLAGLQPTFTDGASIPTWAWGFVNVASYMGIINGYADGSFGPSAPVSYAEAVTMLIRAVPGHVAQVPAGVWPYNFLFYGVDAGFTGNVDVGFASLPCTRGDMAKLLFAMMQVNQLYVTGDNAGKEKPDTAILTDRLFEGTLEYNPYMPAIGVILDEGGFVGSDFGDPVYLVGGQAYDDVVGLHGFVVTDTVIGPDSKAIFVWKTEGNLVKGVFDSYFTDTATGDNFIKLADGTKVPVLDNDFEHVIVTLNGRAFDALEFDGARSLTEGDELTINLNEAGEAVSVVALRWDLIRWCYDWTTIGPTDFPDTVYYHDVITSVDKSTATESENTELTFYDPEIPLEAFYYADGTGTYEVNSNEGQTFEIPETALVYVNGKLAGRDDLAAFDVVKMASWGAWGYQGDAEDIFAVSATRTTVEGTVTASRTVFPGPKCFGTVKTGDASKDYQLDVGVDPAAPKYLEGATAGLHTYLLDESGLAFFDKEYTAANPFVIVTGAETRTGSETKYFVTVDNKGKSETYECTADAQEWIGFPVLLELNGATGVVEDIHRFQNLAGFTILAIGPDNVTVLQSGPTYDFYSVTAVYSDPDGDMTGFGDLADDTFIGLGALEVGQHVHIFWVNPADPEGAIGTWPEDWAFIIVRDDSPLE